MLSNFARTLHKMMNLRNPLLRGSTRCFTLLKLFKKPAFILIALTCLMSYAPLLYMIRASFYTEGQFNFSAYKQLLTDHALLASLLRSLFLAVLASLAATWIGSILALVHYWSPRRLFAFNEIPLFLVLLLPDILLASSWLCWFNLIGKAESFFTLWVAHTSFCIPFCSLLVKTHLKTMDASIFEAARDLGASSTVILTKLLLPQLSPTIIACFFLSFFLSLDDITIASFLAPPSFGTLSQNLLSFSKLGGDHPLLNAMAFSSSLASLLFCIIIQSLYKNGPWVPVKPPSYQALCPSGPPNPSSLL